MESEETDSEWKWPRVFIGRFGRKGALVYYMGGGSIEVDQNDPTSPNKISDVLDCEGPAHLHLTDKKSHIQYLVDPVTLVFLEKIRNAI